MLQDKFSARWESVRPDPRRHFSLLIEGGARLLLRPGPAEAAARELAAARPVGAPRLELLERAEPGRITAARSALRREPAHAAEQIGQLRLGDVFQSWWRSEDGDWCLGVGEDGYPGWLRAWHWSSGGGGEPDRVVCARQSRALEAPHPEAAVLQDLSLGVRLRALGPAEGGFTPWRLPDGRAAWTPAAELEPWPGPQASRRARVLARAARLLGVPYEWGGASSAGVDCSGLVQLLLGSVGRLLPRDADLQAEGSEAASMRGGRPGDLLYYGGERVDHVGLLWSLNPIQLLHASGCVRLEKLGSEGELRGRPLRVRLEPF